MLKISFLLTLLLLGNTFRASSAEQTSFSKITAGEYCDFLNAVAATDSLAEPARKLEDGRWQIGIGSACILCSGTFGDYSYSVIQGKEDSSMTGISYLDAAQYCSWKNNASSFSAGSTPIFCVSCASDVDSSLKSNQLTFQIINLAAVSNLAAPSSGGSNKDSSWEKFVEGVVVVGMISGSGDESDLAEENDHSNMSEFSEASISWNKAEEASHIAHTAAAESHAVSPEEANWEQTIQKTSEAQEAWMKTILLLENAHDVAAGSHQEALLRAIEEARDWSTLCGARKIWLQVNQQESLFQMALHSEVSGLVSGRSDFSWSPFIPKAEAIKIDWGRTSQAFQDGRNAAPERLKFWWIGELENINHFEATWASKKIWMTAQKAEVAAERAIATSKNTSEINKKRETAKQSWSQAVTLFQQGHDQAPEHWKSWWKEQIESVKNSEALWMAKSLSRQTEQAEEKAQLALEKAKILQAGESISVAEKFSASQDVVQKAQAVIDARNKIILPFYRRHHDEAPECFKNDWKELLQQSEKQTTYWNAFLTESEIQEIKSSTEYQAEIILKIKGLNERAIQSTTRAISSIGETTNFHKEKKFSKALSTYDQAIQQLEESKINWSEISKIYQKTDSTIFKGVQQTCIQEPGKTEIEQKKIESALLGLHQSKKECIQEYMASLKAMASKLGDQAIQVVHDNAQLTVSIRSLPNIEAVLTWNIIIENVQKAENKWASIADVYERGLSLASSKQEKKAWREDLSTAKNNHRACYSDRILQQAQRAEVILKAEIEKANKTESEAPIEWIEERAAAANLVWDNIITKAQEAAAAWHETADAFSPAEEANVINQNARRDHRERALHIEKIWTATARWIAINKIKIELNVLKWNAERATTSTEALRTWDEALAKNQEEVTTWEQVTEHYQSEYTNAPQQFKQEWLKELGFVRAKLELARNQEAALQSRKAEKMQELLDAEK